MDFKDYYAALGVESAASAEAIKRSYRKLARKYHPDVSKEPDAEERFKEVAEAYKALKDPEKRAAYDAVAQRYRHGESFDPPPGWDSGFEFRGRGAGGGAAMRAEFHPDEVSDFFASLFGRARRGGGTDQHFEDKHGAGADRHAKIVISLADAYCGAKRRLSLQVPRTDAHGRIALREHQIDITIPRGVRAGQSLRLAGQGEPGLNQQPAGDLYLEIQMPADPTFRLDGNDVYFELPVAPWEAALGAEVTAPTPTGPVQLQIPPGSASGRSLRLKGRGLPSTPPGDLYAHLVVAHPSADSEQAKEAYAALARAFPDFAPRRTLAS